MKKTRKTQTGKAGAPKRLRKKKPFWQRWAQQAREARVQWLLTGLVFCIIVAMLTREPQRNAILAGEIDTSEVPSEDILAAFSFQTVDRAKTQGAREEAAAAVSDYYRIDRDLVREQLAQLDMRIAQILARREEVAAAVLEALRQSNSAQPAEEVVTRTVSGYVSELKQQPEWEEMPEASVLTLWLRPDLDSLPEREFAEVAPPEETGAASAAGEVAPLPVVGLNPPDAPPMRFAYAQQLSELARNSLEYVLRQGIRQPALQPGQAEQEIVIVRYAPVGDQKATSETKLAAVLTPSQAQELLNNHLIEAAKRAAQATDDPVGWARLHDAAVAMAAPLIVPTIEYDQDATLGARRIAREDVEPVMKEIIAGEKIQGGGERWQPQAISDLQTYQEILRDEQRPEVRIFASIVAHMLFAALVLAAMHRSIGILADRRASEARNFLYLSFLILSGCLVVGRIAMYFEPSGFLVPVAAGAVLFAILVNVRLAVMVSLLSAGLLSAQYNYDWRLLAVGCAMSLAGVFSIYRVRRRSDMAKASINATIVGLVMMVAISLAMDSLLSEAAWRRLALIALNGGICMLAVPGLLSPLERLFGITTDIQLLEYSDLNNELLSRLAIEAPGTYAHSLQLGQIAEAAANAIGANGLLARVSAYYHDIGKLEKAEYFSENQTGHNVHDELPPRASARAIAAHVTRGAKLADQYHLPKPIIDAIKEHHGTALIGYFYSQRLDMQKHGDVREEDFRYPGPKPQSPEAAILMICDGSESGVRSLKSPNEERVREFVRNIIDSRLADGQFDECGLTLKELYRVGDEVTRRIVTSLHTRIPYPPRAREAEEPKPDAAPAAAAGE